MKTESTDIDKAAIGLSLVCAVHCLLFPSALVLLPALTATTLGGEGFHQWMLVAVLPTSLIALTMGCRLHRDLRVLALGLSGLGALSMAAFFGDSLFGETGEKLVSLVGASLIAFSHWRNHILCRRLECGCETT
jgi:hypothetical protein